jgi:hypothetical protein
MCAYNVLLVVSIMFSTIFLSNFGTVQSLWYILFHLISKGHRVRYRDRMVVGLTTACSTSAYHH